LLLAFKAVIVFRRLDLSAVELLPTGRMSWLKLDLDHVQILKFCCSG
jgi:hypothetical protein